MSDTPLKENPDESAVKIYIDNNIISALARDQFPEQMDALNKILELRDSAEINIVTSKVTADEIKPYRGPSKGKMEALYARLAKVPFADDHKVLGFHSQWGALGGVANPLVEDDSISSCLRSILTRKKRKNRIDAHHLMLAIRNDCDVFLTCDIKTILKKAKEIKNKYKIKLMQPTTLLQELGKQQNR